MYDYEDDSKYMYLVISFVIAMVIFFGVVFTFIVTYEPPKVNKQLPSNNTEWRLSIDQEKIKIS